MDALRRTGFVLGLGATLLGGSPQAAEAAPPNEPGEVAEPQPDTAAKAPATGSDEPLPGDDEPAAAPSGVTATAMQAIILPTQLREVGAGKPLGKSQRRALRRRVASLNALLRDTAPDLGLVVDLAEPPVAEDEMQEHELLSLARERRKLVILPILEVDTQGRKPELRLVAASPRSQALYSRVQRASVKELPVRGVVLLRDVITELQRQPEQPCAKPPEQPLVKPAHSEGRAILAISGTLYGAFVGYSLQRSSGSDDPRLLYPLLAIGGGVGLGAAIIVADEWDVGPGDAWYLAAGTWWPAVAGHLIYEGRFGDTPSASPDEAWSFGLIASTTGLTLSTVGLLSRGMGTGGAVLAHSGGGVGMIVGTLTEIAVTGESDRIPYGGMGYGAAAGWLLAAATAVHWQPDPWRVLIVDLGLLLGGLAGASAASPLIFDAPTEDKTRGWVAAAGGGLLLGGGLAWYFTREPSTTPPQPPENSEPASRPEDVVYRWELPLPMIMNSSLAAQDRHPGAIAPSPQLGVQWHLRLW